MLALQKAEFNSWQPQLTAAQQQQYTVACESGQVIYCPQLDFELEADEQHYLDPQYCSPRAKNISYCIKTKRIKGLAAPIVVTDILRRMVDRYAHAAQALVCAVFPYYRDQLRMAKTSLRMIDVVGRSTSYRKDDTRLHVDAFPSAPNQGQRLLRVFSNINPNGVPRVWRLGESFERVAQRFLPATKKSWPGLKYLMAMLNITKGVQSDYDHLMLQIHHHMKADRAYQHTVSQQEVSFAAGTTWIVFTDSVSHAAMSGQFLLEQTFMLPVDAMQDPAKSPLRTLERLTERVLV